MRLQTAISNTITRFPWLIFERETGEKLRWNDSARCVFPALFESASLGDVISEDISGWVGKQWSNEGFYVVNHTHNGRHDRAICEVGSDFVTCVFSDANMRDPDSICYPFTDWKGTPIENLKQSQRVIVAGISDGLTLKEIAASLDLSTRRVQELTKHASETTGVYGIGPLVRMAVQYGLNSESVHYGPIFKRG